MKKRLLFLVIMLFSIVTKIQSQRFTTYNQGADFTSIAVDPITQRVWAGSWDSGLYKLELNQENIPINFSTFESNSPIPFSDVTINSLAVNLNGDLVIGQDGVMFTNSEGHSYAGHLGGIDIINRNLVRRHYFSDIVIPSIEGDGLGTKRVNSLTIDVNGKIWVAHKAHFWWDMVTNQGDILYPGVLSSKGYNDFDFKSPGSMYDAEILGNGHPAELPRHNNFLFLPLGANPPQREFFAVSTDNTEVWTSVDAYVAQGDVNMLGRILRYDLSGNFLGEFSFSEIGLGKINNICRNNEKGTWVASLTGEGFSVYKDGEWKHMNSTNFPNVIPPSTYFHGSSMWKDKNGKVYIGTSNGLIVYDGLGAVDDQGSYKIYTNYDFEADPLSDNYDSYVFDDTMISKNIMGGCTNPNDSRENWIATNNGIMKMGIREGVELWHINNYMGYAEYYSSPEEESYNKVNTTYIGNIKNTTGIPENEIVTVTADGTKSSFLRIYTDDPQGYYDGNYTLTAGYGLDGEEDEYGKFTIKTFTSHENYDASLTESANIAQYKYVEYIYQHPKYVDFVQCEDGEIYRFLNFKIINQNNDEIFNESFKLSRSPILLAHGVWSSIDSLQELENYFLNNGYPKSMLIKAWRTWDEAAEDSYEAISWIIPSYIDKLKEKAAKDKISVGKVNVVAHSRGGLYTRAYIEDIHVSFMGSYTKRKDVNSLITLDTPHFGSQGSNVVLDKRVVPYLSNINVFIDDLLDTLSGYPDFDNPETITVGDIASIPSVPENDRIENWGARNLLVEDDDISGIEQPEDPEFIKRLNNDYYHSKLVDANVPIHTFSAEFDICNASPILCNDIVSSQAYTIAPKKIKAVMFLTALILDGAPQGLNTVLDKLYNNEPNDFIVPKSSMTGGLSSSQNTNYLATQGNFDHTGMFGNGIANSTTVLSDIYVLLTRNVNDENYFSKNGLIRTNKPAYNFLATTLEPALQRQETDIFVSKILINRDPVIFDSRTEGDVLNFNVYQEDVDRIMITYEGENDLENFGYEIQSENLSFENPFTYTIPAGYSGELKITAYGYKNGLVGIAKSVVTLNIAIPDTITLESIHFATENPIILEQDNYMHTVMGTYSDGIDRILNNNDITFTIEESTILSQVDNNTVKGENVGTSLFNASINGFEDTIIVKVRENSSLQQTILTSFYGIPNGDNTAIDVNWETLREYENASFALEISYNTPENFSEINQQAGNGTTETPAQFNYTDTSFGSNTLIYYRIKMTDTSGNITYSSIIEVNLSTASIVNNDISNLNLELYPNPTSTGEVTLKLNSSSLDKNAKLELYNLHGKQLAKQNLNVIEGNNTFKLKIGTNLNSGIYLIRVSTNNYIKTTKLIVE